MHTTAGSTIDRPTHHHRRRRPVLAALAVVLGLLAGAVLTLAGPAPSASAAPGQADWRWVFGGSGNNDGVRHITSDAAGNSYVMGTVQNTTTWDGQTMTQIGLWDIFVAKLDPAGSVQWVRTIGSAGSDIPDGIAVDGSGNVYALLSFNISMTIGGQTLASTGIFDIALVKFDANGTYQWMRKIGGQTSSDDEDATGLSVDAQGNTTVLGTFDGTLKVGATSITATGVNQDLFLARFDAAGNLGWLKGKGHAGAYEEADAIVPFGSGFVIAGHQGSSAVTIDGITRNPPPGMRGFTAWFDAGGTATALAAFSGGGTVIPADMAVLPSGDAVVVGRYNTSVVTDATTLTTPAGVDRGFVVTTTVGGTAVDGFALGATGETWARAVDVDEAGNLAVNLRYSGTINLGGIAYGSTGGRDALTALVTPTGAALWSTKVGSVGDEEVDGLDVTADGDILVGGDMDDDATVVGQGFVLTNPQAWLVRVDDPVGEVGDNRYFPMTPTRVLDSRDGTGTPAGPWTAGQTRQVKVAGVAGVPNGASAVVLNVTGTGPTAATHLTAFPAGQVMPTSSNLNLAPGETAANLVTVKVGNGGNISLFNNSGNVQVIADVVGWYEANAAGNRFTGVAPKRLVDTRDGTGGSASKLGAGESRTYTLAGVAGSGVPADAKAVVVNVTGTGGSAATHLTAWPAGQARPNASTVNVAAGATRPNLAIVALNGSGQASFFNNAGSIHLIVDVVGYFRGASGAQMTPVVPARILDSRNGLGGVVGPWGPGQARTVRVGGLGGAPSTASAVVLNVTVTGPSAPSHLTVWPAGPGVMPVASNLNFVAGQTVPNQVIVKTGTLGALNVFNNSGNAHVIIDVVGWYA